MRQAVVSVQGAALSNKQLIAYVVPNLEEALENAELTDFLNAKLPRYMVPKAVEVLEELPKTTSGKVDYPALRRREGLS